MNKKQMIKEFWAEEDRPAILDLKARGLLRAEVIDGEVCLFLKG